MKYKKSTNQQIQLSGEELKCLYNFYLENTVVQLFRLISLLLVITVIYTISDYKPHVSLIVVTLLYSVFLVSIYFAAIELVLFCYSSVLILLIRKNKFSVHKTNRRIRYSNKTFRKNDSTRNSIYITLLLSRYWVKAV